MLEVENLHAFYGKSHVLQGVNLSVRAGEIVSLLGRNGAGRSTTVKAIMGLVQAQGSVRWNGHQLLGRKAFEIARLGLGYVPENRDIFARLSVQQNLLLGIQPGQKRRPTASRWSLDDLYALFPILHERRHTEAGMLSGGEQQMLALARTLMGDPALVLVDEPTEGLAPQMVARVAQFLRELRRRGVGVLLVEQKLTIALDICDRCFVMGHGQIVFEGSPQALRDNFLLRAQWLAV